MTGHQICQIRKNLGLNQAELAQLLGVHGMTVSKWERGVLHPNPYQASLLERFGVAAEKRNFQNQLGNLLLSAGIAAVLYLLLRAVFEEAS
jgi:putative transcriptional regulator